MIDVELLRHTADEMLSGLMADAAMRERIRFKATALDKLPEIAGEMLGGFSATPALRHRILLAARRKKIATDRDFAQTQKKPVYQRLIPAAGMAFAMALMVWFGYLYGGAANPALPAPQGESDDAMPESPKNRRAFRPQFPAIYQPRSL